MRHEITTEELKRKIENGDTPLLIDVREPFEHEEFNIGGKLIPLAQLPQALPELQDQKKQEIVVYCRSGNRSGMAQQILLQNGFENVLNLKGGMLAWTEKD